MKKKPQFRKKSAEGNVCNRETHIGQTLVGCDPGRGGCMPLCPGRFRQQLHRDNERSAHSSPHSTLWMLQGAYSMHSTIKSEKRNIYIRGVVSVR